METTERTEIISASEIGSYMFCNRAWWLKRSQDMESANIAEMSRGTLRHEKHARSVRGATVLQRTGYGLIALALILIAVYFILQFS